MSNLNFSKSIFALLFISLFFAACETDDVDPPPPNVSLSVAPAIIAEDQGTATVTATISTTTKEDVTVTLVATGTASGGDVDYAINSLTLTIQAGETTGTATVTAVQDDVEEGNETIVLNIQTVVGAFEDGIQEVTITIEDDDVAQVGQLLINEVLYDPSNSGLDGDANGDGTYSQAQDEFLEFVNLSASELDVSGYKIYDEENLAINSPNHTIPPNTIIPPGGALLIFGGGTPTGSFGGAIVQTSTSGDFNMNNAGDKVYVHDANDVEVLTFDIEPLSNNPNESYTRNPDLTGDFVQHTAAQAGVLFSPGTKIDGSPF
jgi:hypothetical protein